MKNSPWDYGAKQVSPNGDLVAEIKDAHEVAMGGPTWGTMEISNGMKIEDCNTSFRWSNDSRYLAVPQWTPKRKQRLIVVDVLNKKTYPFSETYRVLQLETFEDGKIEGIDSPIHMPYRVSRDIEELKL